MATSSDDIRDEDRLPWLETVEQDYDDGPSMLRVAGFVLIGLVFIAALVFGVYWIQQHRHPAGGNGQLIAAQEGDYKVKPDEPGGMKAEGEGTAALATSQGADNADAAIDLGAVPEAPITGKAAPHAMAPVTPGSPTALARVPASAGTLKAQAPVSAPRASTASAPSGALVQLGAYPDRATADAAWKGMAARFAYLAPLGQSVEQADVNGSSVYRLRVNAGSASAASQLCGKLKVAGKACFIP